MGSSPADSSVFTDTLYSTSAMIQIQIHIHVHDYMYMYPHVYKHTMYM